MSSEAMNESRRRFLKAGGAALSLSLPLLGGAVSRSFVSDVFAGTGELAYRDSTDLYRAAWSWDKVVWGSHTNACLPTSCSFRVYVKDGMVWREEQTAHNRPSDSRYPDYNPLGCQKGCSFHANLYSDERLKYPLKRVGERGSGQWQRISWDEALAEIADAIVDALAESGSDSFLLDAPHFHGGSVAYAGAMRFNAMLGGVTPDLSVLIGDYYHGFSVTAGKVHTGYSADNLFDAELIFLTCTNWSYTMPALYHFLTEARMNGSELVSIAPDYNPSSIHADYHVPVKPGTDAAFWLGMCQVMIDEALFDRAFVQEQTDLALLLRQDNGRYLRQTDVTGDGREDQLYFWDLAAGRLAAAPRATLAFEGDQALDGEYAVSLADGTAVTVEPVFAALRRMLAAEYTPEKAAAKCGVHASLIVTLARKMASKRTAAHTGFNSAKIYHGDLGERALVLAAGLSGNWGKPGTGWNSWSFPGTHINALIVLEEPVARGGLEREGAIYQRIAEQARRDDPEITEELIAIEAAKDFTTRAGIVPPAILFYAHWGFRELYDRKDWQDAAFGRGFGECLEEATAKGWWDGRHLRPAAGIEPRVMMLAGSNPLRRVRSGAAVLPEHLFPKLKMMFAIEPRMSFSALHCDLVLPCAWHYEKDDLTLPVTTNPRFAFIEQAVEPLGEARHEWDIFVAIADAIAQAAARRGLSDYALGLGGRQRYDALSPRFTMGGHLRTHGDALAEIVAIGVATRMFPAESTVGSLREQGMIEMVGHGDGYMMHTVANDYDPRKPFYSLRWHVDDKKPFPTYNRRMQFYIDHEWFLAAGEQLPVYKPAPRIGGDHPFAITGGHPRHSIHTLHLTQPSLMRLHRGQPVMHMNDRDAAARDIRNGETVEVFNDFSDFRIMVRTSPSIAPGQVVVYMWEGHQFPEWKIYDRLLIGQPKPLYLAGGYGQLRFYAFNGSPGPTSDRGVRVDIRKLATT
ncbi:MAG: molybdopterin-dependent oxidoreductase [Gammaproteobacteria bacterium]|nr:molybdopterin-dependent oxidoreductase [Gammaproteobacteria bacterium]